MGCSLYIQTQTEQLHYFYVISVVITQRRKAMQYQQYNIHDLIIKWNKIAIIAKLSAANERQIFIFLFTSSKVYSIIKGPTTITSIEAFAISEY